MASSTKDLLSIREYLALDRSSPVRNEYFEGEIFAMTGASRRHNLISLHLAGDLDRQLTDRDCEVYASEMRVKVADTGLYTYRTSLSFAAIQFLRTTNLTLWSTQT